MGTPVGTTNETNPEIHVSAPNAVAYRYSINGAPYSGELPVQTPIHFTGDVHVGGRTFTAGTRDLFDFVNLRGTDQFFTQFVDGVTLANLQTPLQITYVLNARRAAMEPENILNLRGAGVEMLDVNLQEKNPAGNRYELSALAVTGGELSRQPSADSTKRLLLSLPLNAASITLTPWANNGLTTIAVNGLPSASGNSTVVSYPAGGSVISLQTSGPDGSHVSYAVEVRYDETLDKPVYRSFYLRAFDPSSAYVSIRNHGANVVSFGMTFNQKLGLTMQGIIREIEAMAPEYPDEPLYRKAWRFVRANRYYSEPLTGARWYHSPALFFNSAGFGYCDDAASLFRHLLTAMGYTARVWGLSGHVVPEVLVNNRWEMWDSDLEVYYRNRNGLIAGVEELAADPDLIIHPVDPLPGTLGAYDQWVADAYSSQADNAVSGWYADPASLIDSPMIFEIPPGATFEFPDVYDTPLSALHLENVPTYTNARLIVPAGFSGPVSMPLIIQSIGWSNNPTLSVVTMNAAGQWDAQPIVASWTVDSVPPVTTASQPSGDYNPEQLVTLTTNEPATIHYTVDGSTPTEASPVYAAPVALTPADSVKFFAVDPTGNREMVRAYGPPVGAVALEIADTTATSITFSSSASGGTGSYEYMYLLIDPRNVWSIAQRYSPANSWTMNTAGVPAGSYSVQVWVRNAGMTVDYDKWAETSVLIEAPPSAPVLENPGDQTNDDNSGSYADEVLSDAPVAYWRLGEASGAVAADHAGTSAGAVFGSVALGQTGALADADPAMLFNGSTGYVRVGNSAAVQLTGDLTIELWINVPLTARQTLISKDYAHEFELTLETTGRLNFFQGNGSTYQGTLSDFGAVTAATWQHVVVTREAATKTVRFYVNGVRRGCASYTISTTSSASPVSIGRSESATQYVNGRLDEVALYPVALSAAQIATHYVMRASAGSGTPIELPLAASDPNGDSVTFSATGLPPGLTINPATGLISGILTQASAGIHHVTATVSDGSLSQDQTFTWTVTHVNRPPALTGPGNRTSVESTAVSLQLTAADPDGDALTYSATGLPPSLSLDPVSGLISGTLLPESAGTYVVTVTASDGSLVSDQNFTWTVIQTNRPPVLLNPGSQMNTDIWGYSQAVIAAGPVGYWRLGETTGTSAADSTGINPGTVFGGVTLGQAGALADGHPAMRFNGSTGYVRVANSPAVALAGDLTIELWLNVSLATRQTLISKDYLHEFELTLETSGQLNFYQGNGTSYVGLLSAAAISANTWQHVVVTRVAATNTVRFYVNGIAKGSGTYVTAPAAGTRPISIGRSDGGTQYVNGWLDEVALYPAALSPAQVAAHYALRTSVGTPTSVALPLVASDPDGDGLTYSATGLPSGLTVNATTGVISGTLTLASVGTHQVTATASDGALADSQTFAWTVTHVNRHPSLTSPGPQISAENSNVSLGLVGSDQDGDALTYSATGLPASLTLNATTGLITGTLSFTSAGTYVVTATVSDGSLASASQTFTWTVANTNRGPALANPGAQTHTDTSGYAQAVLADAPAAYWRLGETSGTNAADGAGANPGTVFGGVTLGQAGVLADGNPAMRFNGSTGYVRAANNAVMPLAGDLTIELWLNVSLATRQTLISKDYLHEFELTLETSGKLTLYQGNGATYEGTSVFGAVTGNTWQHVVVTRTASTKTIRFYVNGILKGSSAYATVPTSSTRPITIGRSDGGTQYVNGLFDEVALYPAALSAAQVAAHYALRTSIGTPTVVALQLIASDPDGDALTYGATGLPSGLTVNAATGLISGTLAPASAGIHQVTATVSDGNLTASQTFTWTVSHINRSPALTSPGTQTSAENANVSVQLVASDPDGDALTYSATGLPASLSLDPATGLIAGTLSFTSAGTYVVTATVSDGSLASPSQTFTWTVANTNRAPVLTNPGAQTHADVSGYGQGVMADAPAAYWRLGETTGASAADSAGANPGTVFGGVTLGQTGALADGNPAMLFNGSTGYVRAANNTAMPLAGDLTIELWLNVSLATRQTLISKDYLHEFELTLETSGKLTLYQGNGVTYEGTSVFGAVTANTWQHVVVTRTAATKTMRFYVNGILKGSGAYTTVPASSTKPISIGRSDGGTQYVNGRLDEVALYPAALSAAQVAAHYALRTSLGTPTVVALQLIASDPDGDPLAYSAIGLPSALSIDATTGLISGTLSPASAGTYPVTITASDGAVSSSQTFTWTVTHVN